jgi:hypothetical protein
VGSREITATAGVAGARGGYLPNLTGALVTGMALSAVALRAVAMGEQ